MSGGDWSAAAERARLEDHGDVRLRNVEIDVVIPKRLGPATQVANMKEAAKERCAAVVEEFNKCCRGKTLSIVWACREQKEALRQCMTSQLTNELFDEEKEKFLAEKRDFQSKLARGENPPIHKTQSKYKS